MRLLWLICHANTRAEMGFLANGASATVVNEHVAILQT